MGGLTNVRLIDEWIDQAGGYVRAASWVFAPVGLATYEAAIQACSNGVLQFSTNGIPTISAAAPVAGQYDLVQDLAVLVFATIPGSTIRVTIPAPQAGIFGPSSNVVNPAHPAVAALIAAVIGTLGDAGGNAATAYVSGIKVSRRAEQT